MSKRRNAYMKTFLTQHTRGPYKRGLIRWHEVQAAPEAARLRAMLGSQYGSEMIVALQMGDFTDTLTTTVDIINYKYKTKLEGITLAARRSYFGFFLSPPYLQNEGEGTMSQGRTFLTSRRTQTSTSQGDES